MDKKIVQAVLERSKGLCEVCYAPGTELHHIIHGQGVDIEFINRELKPKCKCIVGFVNVDDLYYKNNFPQEYECSWIK